MTGDDRPRSRLRYDGPKQRARRAAILEATRDLIAKHGHDGFSVRKLADVSGVSVKTLYNLDGDKPALIQEAVRELFDTRIDIEEGKESDPLDYMLGRIDRTSQTILAMPNFARAMAFSYFSSPDAAASIEASRASLLSQFTQLAESKRLLPNISLSALATLGTYHLFSVVAKWGQGIISDHDLPKAMKASVLLAVAGAGVGETRDRALALFAAECIGAHL